jgi:excisionase family DNA binding protein
MENPRELLRPLDIASSLGLTTGRIYQLITAGVLPHVRVGRTIYIPRQAWEQWLKERSSDALSAIGNAVVPGVDVTSSGEQSYAAAAR